MTARERKQAKRPVAGAAPQSVLKDHKRVGKRFLPPFLYLIGNMHETKWLDRPVPELVWITLLIGSLGLRRANQVAVDLAKAASGTRTSPDRKMIWFASTSAFATLDATQQAAVITCLQTSQSLDELRRALRPLVAWYPEC